MNDYLDMAKEWWSGLQTRERLYLSGGAAAVVVMILWGMIWDPLSDAVANYESGILGKQNDLQWMKTAAAQIQSIQGTLPNRQDHNRSLLALLEERINNLGLKSSLARMNPEGSSQVKFWLNAGNFDQLIRLFGELEQQYGVTVTSMSITATDQPGLVDARVTVARGGS